MCRFQRLAIHNSKISQRWPAKTPNICYFIAKSHLSRFTRFFSSSNNKADIVCICYRSFNTRASLSCDTLVDTMVVFLYLGCCILCIWEGVEYWPSRVCRRAPRGEGARGRRKDRLRRSANRRKTPNHPWRNFSGRLEETYYNVYW